MPSGYEKSPDYGGPPWRPRDEIVWIILALAVLGGLVWFRWT